jgi:hypothetical protein
MNNRYSARNPVYSDSLTTSRLGLEQSLPNGQGGPAEDGQAGAGQGPQDRIAPTFLQEQNKNIYLKKADYQLSHDHSEPQEDPQGDNIPFLESSGALPQPRSRSLSRDNGQRNIGEKGSEIHKDSTNEVDSQQFQPTYQVVQAGDVRKNPVEISFAPQPIQTTAPLAPAQPLKVEIRRYADMGIRKSLGGLPSDGASRTPPGTQNYTQAAPSMEALPQSRSPLKPPTGNAFQEPMNIRPDQNESTDTIQNLSSFLNVHVKQQSQEPTSNQNTTVPPSVTSTQHAFDIFGYPPPMKKSPSTRSILHQNALNELSDDPRQLKSDIQAKDREIRFLKERLDLLHESARMAMRPKPTESASHIREFKLEQLSRNLKAQRSESDFLKKQIATTKTELDRIVNHNSRAIYDMRINFDQETRTLMEEKETALVMNSLNMDHPEVASLATRLRSLLAAQEAKQMKGFLSGKR